FQVTPKVSHIHAVKRIFIYLEGQPKLGLWYPRDSLFDLEAFSDSDYAGASLDRKSTIGEYAAAANCCGQVLWIQNQMLDYGFNFMNTKIYIDNESTICIVKNPFWQTAITRTLDNGEMEITTTIDEKVKIVTEASVRRHLKLEDFDGISILPTIEIFEQLALMSSKKTVWEQFSSNITTALICLATNRMFNFSKMIFDGMVKNFDIPVESHHTPTGAPSTSPPHLSSPPRSSIRQETEVPQPSSPTHTYVANEAAFTDPPSMPHDSPLLRVNTLKNDDDRMQHNELMDLVIELSDRVLALEEDLKQTKKVYDAAYTKLILKVKKLENTVKTSQARRKAKIVVSDMEKNVHTYTRRRAVSTGSGEVSIASRMISTAKASVSTAGASMPVSTAGMIDKGKGIMEESESDVTKTKRQQEQERLGHEVAVRLQEEFDEEKRQMIARIHKAAQSFSKEEWENMRARVKANEELTQRLQAEERNKYSEVDQAKMLVDLINQRKRYFA
nr:hypothetical protein [Tanacetum cinerariifolium]